MSASDKSRRYCFTAWAQPNFFSKQDGYNFRFIYMGLEECPETGRTHWQGYVEFDKPTRYTSVTKEWGLEDSQIWWNKARGTAEQNMTYCGKGGQVWTWGTPGSQGKRSDIDDMKTDIVNGCSMFELMQKHSAAWRYNNAAMRFRLMCINHRRDYNKKEVIVLMGPPGVGKTRYAYDNYTDIYVKPPQGKWWDGYDGEDVVLIDEFDHKDWNIGYLNQICDGYPVKLEVKGGVVTLLCSHIIITTNIHIDAWFPSASQDQKLGLRRRITKVINFWDEVGGNKEPPTSNGVSDRDSAP